MKVSVYLFCPRCGRPVAQAEVKRESHSMIPYHATCGADVVARRDPDPA
jgi:hypothetical protein